MILLPKIFSDGAVFQRRMPCAFWGWTNEKTFVEVRVGEFPAVRTISSPLTGSFKLYLPPVEGPGPYTLSVKNIDTGEELLLKDVLFGEVYLCSGQSNMEFAMKSSPGQLEESLAANTAEESRFIRYFNVKRNSIGTIQDDCEGSWKYSSNENLPECSAVGYHFAVSLYKELHVPIGILHSSWGGTRIETWISHSALRKNPLTSAGIKELAYTFGAPANWKGETLSGVDQSKYFEQNCTKDPGISENARGFAVPLLDDRTWKVMEVPGDWICWNIGGHGACWFRKKVTIPAEWAGKELELHLCVTDKHDITYFNGEEVGRTGKDFEYIGENRKYTIPAHLVKEGENVIAVRIYSFAFGCGFYGDAKCCFISLAGESDPEKGISIAGAWKAQMELTIPELTLKTASIPVNRPGNPQTYGGLYNSMIHPLRPYGISGVLWYQGETNANGIEKSKEYASLLAALVEDWRDQFEQQELPFYVVSLAGYRQKAEYAPTDSWAYLRESQRKVSKMLPEVYITAAHDLGEVKDVHPKDKRSVGERLARQALYHCYGKRDLLPSGPDFVKARKEGDSLRVTFDFAKGLHTADGEKIRGFYIAGTNGIFYAAEAKIEGEELILSSKDVKDPFCVRYAWSDFPITNLVNEEGLPVHPFEV